MKFLDQISSVLRTVLQEPSNRDQRALRVLAAVGWQAYKRLFPFPLVLPLDNGLRFLADPAAGNSVGAIYTRIYESQFVQFARRHIQAKGVMCDVGAHTGLVTLLLAESFTRGVVFEPDAETFALLQSNLRLNGLDHVTAYCAAVSDAVGTGRLKVTGKYSGTTRLASRAKDDSPGEVREVPLATIDETLSELGLSRISFMKIDTEGHESSVLRGAERTLLSSPDALVLYENSSFDEILQFFRKIGWRVFGVDEQMQILLDESELRRAYNLFACGPAHELHRSIDRASRAQ